MWLDENTYYHAEADQFAVDDVWHGAIRWRYVGPAVFHEDDVDVDQEVAVSVDPYQVDSTGDTGLWNSVRVDSQGRKWEVVDIDEREWSKNVTQYRLQVARDFSQMPPTYAELAPLHSRHIEHGDTGGSGRPTTMPIGEFTEFGWTIESCDGPENDPLGVWNSEGRLVQVGDYNSAEEWASVVIYQHYSAGWYGICSGSFIDGDRDVLTAAHCVTNGATQKDPDTLLVCTRGNRVVGDPSQPACFQVIDIIPSGNWNGSTLFTRAHDYAKVIVDTSGQAATRGYIPMSSHPDGTLDVATIGHVGFPGSIYDNVNSSGICVSNTFSEYYAHIKSWQYLGADGGSNTIRDAKALRRDASGSTVSSSGAVLKARIDSGPGASGGAMYMWVNTTPYHVGLVSGHNGGITPWTGGPKTSSIAEWVINAQ